MRAFFWGTMLAAQSACMGILGAGPLPSVGVSVSEPPGLTELPAAEPVLFARTNRQPVAGAGADQTALTGQIVGLDGSGSEDPDEDLLTFAWTLDTPAGSSARLSDPRAVTPSFIPDLVGEYVISLTVSDGQFDASDRMRVVAEPLGDSAPRITSVPVDVAAIGQPYAYEVGASDADRRDALTFSLGSAPRGMTIDPISGRIRWQPSETGTFDVDVRVTDLAGLVDRQAYLLCVSDEASVAETSGCVR